MEREEKERKRKLKEQAEAKQKEIVTFELIYLPPLVTLRLEFSPY